MERKYKEAFAGLNSRQREAVTTIDGPVLVVAGPGTGKTQLVTTRVGHILKTTDTPANAILLLTFTEAGVQAMRERLQELIGRPVYDIQLSTYHAFGGEIFRRYPDLFEGAELSLIEELGSDSLLREIIAKLPYSNPLKFADNYINDIKTFISDCKRALLSADDIEAIARDNLKFIAAANRSCRKLLNSLKTVNKSAVPVFEELLASFSATASNHLPDDVLPLVRYAQGELQAALEHYNVTGKTSLLTEWKRYWLAKDSRGKNIISGQRTNERLVAAAGIFRRYQRRLTEQRQYDYDDMILRAIEALETNPDIKYSLADQYSYIMLDEFQDTNRAQFKLVELLTDHPVHEGRPNVMAVGDDDQAIYAFQGANHANMALFAKHYRDVKIISLKETYRSDEAILQTAKNISSQIQSRLNKEFGWIEKQLVAAAKGLPETPKVSVREFNSDAAQYDFVASEIKKIVDNGIPAGEIAVLAPKHKYLEPLLPYLAEQHLPVHYERRENILDEPLIRQLEQMCRLVIALSEGDERLADHLWPEVLSYDFWKVPTQKIWSVSWQARQTHEPWTAILLNDELLLPIVSFFLSIVAVLPVSSLEQQLDALIGLPDSTELFRLSQQSPMYDYYFSKQASEENPFRFKELISSLNILRSRLGDWQLSNSEPSGIKALVDFIAGHRAANINILNSNPYFETDDAVNLLTAYGAKGREFRVVFVVAAVDEAWGSASRNQGYRLGLPQNLSYIRYQGASEDERLRLLYVAATRARTRLYFTSFSHDLAGKSFSRLKYLEIDEDESGILLSAVLPPKFNKVIADESQSISLRAATNYWTDRHIPPFRPKLSEVLAPRLAAYQLSATDLNYFIDIISYGPEKFFMRCLLYFPSAPTPTDSFGTAIHNTLRSAGRILKDEAELPSEKRLLEIFDAQLSRSSQPPQELKNLAARGQASIRTWLKFGAKDLKATDRYEYNFQHEGSAAGIVKLNGRVDRMSFDEKRRTIIVTDYKTGRSYSRWQPNIVKLHIFQQQLIIYKLLIESSARFKSYTVDKGVIEFVEPNEEGKIDRLELSYDEQQVQQCRRLLEAVWQHIMSLKFPDTSSYPPNLSGVKAFEADLINKNTGL